MSYPQRKPDLENLHAPFPLTDIQTAYLVGRDENFEMGGVSTHVYAEIEIQVDMERFNMAMQKVISRHPMLRGIILPNGEQMILEEVPEYKIEVRDISNLDEERKQACIMEERERMSHYVFKTDEWPLFEFKALRISKDDRYLLIMSRDLLIADAGSMSIMGKDLMAYYKDLDAELPENDFTFRDYMLAYEEFKTSETYANDKKYWLDQLDEFPLTPTLPLKANPANVKKPHFSRVSKRFDKEDWQKLKEIGLENGVTPSGILCAAYARVLAYWSNQSRFAINMTVFNRLPFHNDVQNIIGDFTSIILLGLDIDTKASFWEHASDVQDVLLESLEHRHYDGVEFIRDIARYHDLRSDRAIMPVVFSSALFGQTEEESKSGWDELGEMETGITQTSQVYIDHQVIEMNGNLLVSWDYVEDLFDPDVIDTMFEQYIDILTGLIETGEYIPVLSEDQQTFIS